MTVGEVLGESWALYTKHAVRLIVVAAAFSRSAHKAITDAGGEAQDAVGQPFQFREPRTRRQSAKLDKRLQRLGLPAREKPETPAEESSKKGGKGGKGDKQKGASKKQPSARPTGESGDASSAPESGTQDAAAAPRGKSKKASAEAPTQAPESGDQE